MEVNWLVVSFFFIFTPKIGEDEPILTNIFQMGWNRQLEYYGGQRLVAFLGENLHLPGECFLESFWQQPDFQRRFYTTCPDRHNTWHRETKKVCQVSHGLQLPLKMHNLK